MAPKLKRINFGEHETKIEFDEVPVIQSDGSIEFDVEPIPLESLSDLPMNQLPSSDISMLLGAIFGDPTITEVADGVYSYTFTPKQKDGLVI